MRTHLAAQDSRPRISRLVRWLMISLFAMALVLSGCGGSPPAKDEPETVSGVSVVTLHAEAVPDEAEAPGTVRAAKSAEVAARTMGAVTSVPVREGDRVAAGQLLAQLDDREMGARRAAAQSAAKEAITAREEAVHALAAAEAQSAVARKTYDRFVYLREQKSVSAQEFDEVEAKHRAAAAALEQVKARQKQVEAMSERGQSEARAADAVAGYARVVAPFAGVVVRRNVQPGQMALPGQTLFVLDDPAKYELQVTVDASAIARGLKRGTKARVRIDALPGRELAGTVTEMEAGADAASQTVRAKVALPADAGLQSGLFGRALFCCREGQALAIPRSAIIERGQLSGVYALDAEGIARLRVITLGRVLGDRVEILSGLAEGDRIVSDPQGRALDGKKVSVAP